jgi:hypothetical protein
MTSTRAGAGWGGLCPYEFPLLLLLLFVRITLCRARWGDICMPF